MDSSKPIARPLTLSGISKWPLSSAAVLKDSSKSIINPQDVLDSSKTPLASTPLKDSSKSLLTGQTDEFELAKSPSSSTTSVTESTKSPLPNPADLIDPMKSPQIIPPVVVDVSKSNDETVITAAMLSDSDVEDIPSSQTTDVELARDILENGTSTETSVNSEHTKTWSSSVYRKSDGKPIDGLGISSVSVEIRNITITREFSSDVCIRSPQSDEEEEEDGDRNEFIDDEAEDTNGEDSMDEDERIYYEENEIPESHISLGSDDSEEESDEGSNISSFIVSDSETELLDGTGDDLETSNEIEVSPKKGHQKNESNAKAELNKRNLRSKRLNKISDSSEEELENLDSEPKKKTFKRLSDTMPASKPNEDERPMNGQTNQPKQIDTSEDGGSDELENLASEPERKTSKRLSDTMPTSKKAIKRMSLHPNAKLNSAQVIESNRSTPVELSQEVQVVNEPNEGERPMNGQTNQPKQIDASEDGGSDELENLASQPERKTSKRLSDTMPTSKKAIKRMSLHPSVKLSSVQLIDTQKSNVPTMDVKDDTETMELVQSSDETNITQKPSANKVTLAEDSDSDEIKTDSMDEKMARCNDYIARVNEERRLGRLENKVIKTEKAQRSKEKKERKLQAKKEKEAREEKQAVLAAEQLQRKRDKKKIKENEDPIAKALAFSFKVLQERKHSTKQTDIISVPKKRRAESISKEAEMTEPKKSKMLHILETSQSAVINTNTKDNKTQQIAAKPEGFLVHAKATKSKKHTAKQPNDEKIVEVKKKLRKPQFTSTSAGNFEVHDISLNVDGAATKFKVSSLAGRSRAASSQFNNFKEKSLYNSKIPRESVEQLLSRKEKERKFKS